MMMFLLLLINIANSNAWPVERLVRSGKITNYDCNDIWDDLREKSSNTSILDKNNENLLQEILKMKIICPYNYIKVANSHVLVVTGKDFEVSVTGVSPLLTSTVLWDWYFHPTYKTVVMDIKTTKHGGCTLGCSSELINSILTIYCNIEPLWGDSTRCTNFTKWKIETDEHIVYTDYQ